MRLSRSGLAVMLLGATLTLSGCDWGKASAQLAGYRTGPGSDQITIVYATGPADEDGHVEILEQDSTHVQVRVLYERYDGTQNLIAISKDAVGTLAAPLGDREVLDEAGDELARQ
jgi:hypothetical protein